MTDISPALKVIFCSGNGQFHTNEPDKSNPNKKLLPYKTTTLECIRKFIDKPQEVDKTVAKWVLASSLPSRNFKVQENIGQFWMLWADLDTDPQPLSKVKKCLISIIGNCQFEIYTSKSATKNNQKARILIFLDTCLYSTPKSQDRYFNNPYSKILGSFILLIIG